MRVHALSAPVFLGSSSGKTGLCSPPASLIAASLILYYILKPAKNASLGKIREKACTASLKV
jgi:hypothetical protein